MTIYAIIAALISGVLAYIGYLRSTIDGHQRTIESLKADSENKEFKDAISQATKTVVETEIDYAKSRDEFRNKYGGDGSGSSSQPPK